MNRPKKNIFLTGAPSSGKTTVIRKVIELLDHPASGFYTQEERVAGRRVGFTMKTLDGKQCNLARRDMKSDFHVKDYGVSIKNIEEVAVPSISPRNSRVIVIDEIGKMECFSGLFKEAVTRALDSQNIVVGTITLGRDSFILKIKGRADLDIRMVTLDNRDSLPGLIIKRVTELLKAGSPESISSG
jgi:nucleoside-triphosphatase